MLEVAGDRRLLEAGREHAEAGIELVTPAIRQHAQLARADHPGRDIPRAHAIAHELALQVTRGGAPAVGPEPGGDRDQAGDPRRTVLGQGEQDRIEVATRRAGDGVVITVQDTGVGISHELLPRIFDRFAGDRRPGGRSTGLGLPIARAIVEAHGGSVRAESAPGLQTTITFELPGPIAPEPVAPLRPVAA